MKVKDALHMLNTSDDKDKAIGLILWELWQNFMLMREQRKIKTDRAIISLAREYDNWWRTFCVQSIQYTGLSRANPEAFSLLIQKVSQKLYNELNHNSNTNSHEQIKEN